MSEICTGELLGSKIFGVFFIIPMILVSRALERRFEFNSCLMDERVPVFRRYIFLLDLSCYG